MIKRNKSQTELAEARAIEERRLAAIEARKISRDPLFLIGVSLYWAEGYKKGAQGSRWKSVDFANSDPVMVKLMMKFFLKFCNVDISVFKAQVIAHENLNILKSIEYWSNITKIPANKFIKTTASNKAKRKKNSHSGVLTNGTIHIRINNVRLFYRVIGWIDYLKNNY